MEKVSAAGDVRVFPWIDNGKGFGMSLSSLKQMMEKASVMKEVLVVP